MTASPEPAALPTKCPHLNFKGDFKIARLTKTEGGPVIGYAADVRIKCDQCGLPFRWMGLDAGIHPQQPRVSVDALELRAPIEPAYVTEILGMPLTGGTA
jgi:hypothetical protein